MAGASPDYECHRHGMISVEWSITGRFAPSGRHAHQLIEEIIMQDGSIVKVFTLCGSRPGQARSSGFTPSSARFSKRRQTRR